MLYFQRLLGFFASLFGLEQFLKPVDHNNPGFYDFVVFPGIVQTFHTLRKYPTQGYLKQSTRQINYMLDCDLFSERKTSN